MELSHTANNIYEIKQQGTMRVPARVYASEALVEKMKQDKTLQQAQNVACVPGIMQHSVVLPDGHQGYGMPIGGVAAFDAENGSISPGQTGFDINCGVRVITTNLTREDIAGKEQQLLNILYNKVPLGLGKGQTVSVSQEDFHQILSQGMQWTFEQGYAVEQDLMHAEENGSMDGDPTKASDKAQKRGISQIGSVGSGNHFVEVQEVKDIFDQNAADAYGLSTNQIIILIHSGSRGFGHQVCSDYLRLMEQQYKNQIQQLPDRQLVYGPVTEQLAMDYFGAMQAAANFAWVNRQLLTYNVRDCFATLFNTDSDGLDMQLLYDVCHNIVKKETYTIDGEPRPLYVHRKGATRAFPPKSKDIPSDYQNTGQPVIIPGSMGTASWILKGSQGASDLTFGSTAHGAGRMMSRSQAKREFQGERLVKELQRRRIYVRSRSGGAGVAEEAPGAYKDVDEVIEVSHALNIGRKVARAVPVICVKG